MSKDENVCDEGSVAGPLGRPMNANELFEALQDAGFSTAEASILLHGGWPALMHSRHGPIAGSA